MLGRVNIVGHDRNLSLDQPVKFFLRKANRRRRRRFIIKRDVSRRIKALRQAPLQAPHLVAALSLAQT